MRALSFKRSVALNNSHVLWVVIPARNEEENIVACLDSFLDQTDNHFRIIVVDNGSTDRTKTHVIDWIHYHPMILVDIVNESNPGIGRACRAGCKLALKSGAKILGRTDADTLVDKNWVKETRKSLIGGNDFVAGRCMALPTERSFGLRLKSTMLWVLVQLLVVRGRFRRGLPLSIVVMVGHNLALTAELYQVVGGFTILDVKEDVELHNRILRRTRNGCYNPHMISYTSLRRIKEMGLIKTFLWYVRKQRHPRRRKHNRLG